MDEKLEKLLVDVGVVVAVVREMKWGSEVDPFLDSRVANKVWGSVLHSYDAYIASLPSPQDPEKKLNTLAEEVLSMSYHMHNDIANLRSMVIERETDAKRSASCLADRCAEIGRKVSDAIVEKNFLLERVCKLERENEKDSGGGVTLEILKHLKDDTSEIVRRQVRFDARISELEYKRTDGSK